MEERDRIYVRTEAGQKAWAARDPGLRDEHRTVLGVVDSPMHSDAVRKALRRSSETAVKQWLKELVDLKFLESKPVAPEHDLDFTDRFKLSDLAAAQRAKKPGG